MSSTACRFVLSLAAVGWLCAAQGFAPAFADEASVTEPGMPWPVITDGEARPWATAAGAGAAASVTPGAIEGHVTEPGLPWPVISEAEARQLMGRAADVSVTEPGMPWPVVTEAEANALKGEVQATAATTDGSGGAAGGVSEAGVTEPGMPWPVVDDMAAAASAPQSPVAEATAPQASSAEEGRVEIFNSVTEPGMPWPVIGEVDATPSLATMAQGAAGAVTATDMAQSEAVTEESRSVTEPGMPWPVVEAPSAARAAAEPSAAPAESATGGAISESASGAMASACANAVEDVTRAAAVSFRQSNSALAADSLPRLDKVAAAIKSCDGIRIVIAGHTDSLGSPQINLTLSKERAAAVASYLQKQGVDGRILVTEGYGAERPIASNKTAAERAKNRRIEFRVERLRDETQ